MNAKQIIQNDVSQKTEKYVSQIELNIIFNKLERQSSLPCLELIITNMRSFYYT